MHARSKAVKLISVQLILYLLLLNTSIGQPSFATPTDTSNSEIMDETTLSDEEPKTFDVYQEWWFLSGSGKSPSEWMLELTLIREPVNGREGYLRLQIVEEPLFIVNFSFPLAFTKDENSINLTMGPCKLTIKPDGLRTFEIELDASNSMFIETWSRGIPLWYSKGKDDMLSLTSESMLGGFDDAIRIKMKFKKDGVTQIFRGSGVYEHSYIIGKENGDWVWFIFNGDDIYGILLHSRDPATGQIRIHTGRLGFPENNDFYSFDNYTLITDGGRYPRKFQIEGTFNFTTDYYNVYLNSSSRPVYPFPQHGNHLFVNASVEIVGENISMESDCLALGEVIRPWVNIYIDKHIYVPSETMHLGLDVLILRSVMDVGLNIWLELPSGEEVIVANYTSIPTPIDYRNPSFRTLTIPWTFEGTYVWHTALVNTTTNAVLNEDTVAWELIT